MGRGVKGVGLGRSWDVDRWEAEAARACEVRDLGVGHRGIGAWGVDELGLNSSGYGASGLSRLGRELSWGVWGEKRDGDWAVSGLRGRVQRGWRVGVWGDVCWICGVWGVGLGPCVMQLALW